MKKTILFVVTALTANLLTAATPQEALVAAAKNLGEKSNYSWKLTVEEPDRPTGTIDGKIQKDGTAFLALARGDQAFEAVLKDSKGALKTEEGWKSLAAMANDSGEAGPKRFVARLLQNLQAPSAEIAELAPKIKDLTRTEGNYAGTLNQDTANELFFFHIRPDANGPQLTEGKGSIKIWVKDGLISKYEYSIQGTVSSDGNDHQMKRTYTVEIKDVGTTKVAIPDDASKKLNG